MPSVNERTVRLSELIRMYRRRCAMTQTDVARKIGVSRLTYHRLENGTQNMKFIHLDAICATIGLKSDELLRQAGYTTLAEDELRK